MKVIVSGCLSFQRVDQALSEVQSTSEKCLDQWEKVRFWWQVPNQGCDSLSQVDTITDRICQVLYAVLVDKPERI